jgi:hypothetical protein
MCLTNGAMKAEPCALIAANERKCTNSVVDGVDGVVIEHVGRPREGDQHPVLRTAHTPIAIYISVVSTLVWVLGMTGGRHRSPPHARPVCLERGVTPAR